MNINNAILHVFDFVSCVNVFAQVPMDLGNKAAKRYVASQAKRTLSNLDSKRGTFAENSLFAEELRSYFRGARDFVGLSQQIGEFVVGELSRMEKTPSTDLLVIDFEGDADQTVREMTDEEAEAAYKARGPRYFAIILLEARQAYMHEVGSNDFGDTATTIARHHAILPNPSQKVASFALISADDMAVWFVDKEREIAGEKRWIIPDGLLQCSMEASSREVLQAVTTVVEEVAEEFGANTAVALSRAKAYVAVNAEESDEVDARELGREVFADQPRVRGGRQGGGAHPQHHLASHPQGQRLPGGESNHGVGGTGPPGGPAALHCHLIVRDGGIELSQQLTLPLGRLLVHLLEDIGGD